MNLLTYKILAAILIFIMSLITAIYPLRHRLTEVQHESTALGEALASGIFLGAAFFHLLPEAISTLSQYYPRSHYPLAEGIAVFGFLFLLFLERLSLTQNDESHAHSIPYILALTLIIHALIEGLALGISPFSEALLLFVAILAHKGSESYALCMILLRYALPQKNIIVMVIIFALMTPLGISMGTAINSLSMSKQDLLTTGIFNAFAAGTFLYISTLHHIHFHRHACGFRGILEFISLVVGVVLMGLTAIWM